MNKFLLSAFALVFCSSIMAQRPVPASIEPDTLSMPSDSLDEGLEAIPVEVDDQSYAEEYKKDKFRISFGFRTGLSKTQINTASGDVIRVTPTGLPVIVNEGIARDKMISNSAFGTGFQGAVFTRVTRGSFFFQPELIYATKGGKFDFLDRNGNLLNRVDAKFKAVDLPLLLGIRFRKARVFGGPEISWALTKNQEFDDALDPYTTPDFDKAFFNRPVLNAMFGLGFEFKTFFFDMRYESGIGNYAETNIGPANNPKPFFFSTDQFIFSIGIIK